MKKLLMVLASASLLTLAACGGTEEKQEVSGKAQHEEAKPAKAEQKDVKNEPKKDEDGNFVFEEVGQEKNVDIGHLKLLKYKKINEVVNMSPLNIKIDSIKVFEVTDPTQDFIENADYMADEKVNESGSTYYLQVLFSAENTEEKNVDWMDLSKLVLSNGQQIDAVSKDFITDDNDGDSAYYGKVSKEYVGAYIIKDADINNVKLIFNEVDDSDTYDTLHAEQQVEYTLD
jgi:hypothetical protein